MKHTSLLLFFILASLCAKSQDDISYKNMCQHAISLFNQGKFTASAEAYERAIAIKDDNAGYADRYNTACAWARAGNRDKALKHLNYLASLNKPDPEGAVGKSNQDPLFYLGDDDFKPLHKDPRWAA